MLYPRVRVHAINEIIHLSVVLLSVTLIGLTDEHQHSDSEEDEAKEQCH